MTTYTYGTRIRIIRDIRAHVSPVGMTTLKKDALGTIEVCDDDGITVRLHTKSKTPLFVDVTAGDIVLDEWKDPTP